MKALTIMAVPAIVSQLIADAFTVMVSYAVYLKRGVLREAGGFEFVAQIGLLR